MPPQSAPHKIREPTAEIDLVLFSLDVSEAELTSLRAHLSPEENERSGRFVETCDARRYVAARGRLREVLSSYTGISPGQIQFRFGPRGKPYLASGPQLFFNLSHSAHLATVALSAEFEIGVDVERLRDVRPGLPARYFSASEVEALESLEGDAWKAAFFRCWTRKEAFIKATGMGMHQPLKSFSVSVLETEPARLQWLTGDVDAPRNWTILDIKPEEGFAGAIAVMTGGAPAPRVRILSDAPAQ